MDVILSDTNVVQPDIVVVQNQRRSIITQRAIEGAPDLAIEILSPTGRDRDEHLKYALYSRFGIPEYWIVSPEQAQIAIHVLGEGGYSEPQPCAFAEGA